LRHELFTKGGWSDKFVVDLRSKIEKEFDETPLLRNLGVTIYGSVYESRHQAAATGTAVTGTAATGATTTSHHATKAHHKTVVCPFSLYCRVSTGMTCILDHSYYTPI
jgi:hypothetical protein